MKKLYLICCVSLALGFSSSSHQQAQMILDQMHLRMETIQGYSFHLEIEERRVGNVIHEGEMLVSVEEEPVYIQLETLKPQKGSMVEYKANRDLSATITPKKWLPAVKFKQDIHGKLLRRGHYAIDETRLTYIDDIIQRSEAAFQARGIYQEGVVYKGKKEVKGKLCHQIELVDPAYRIRSYAVKAGDNLIKIGHNELVPPYKIRELNPELGSYYDVSPGQHIHIPSSYAKRSVIFIEEETHLPCSLEIYDERGLFERYHFNDIKIEES